MRRSLRTFIAIEVSPEVATGASELIQRLSPAAAPVNWVAPQNLHITLKFLGDLDMLDTIDVCKAVNAAVAHLPPFDYQVSQAGAFPDVQRPRTIWLGIDAADDALQHLHDAVDDALRSLGFRAAARRFQPHLTLGRVKGSDPASFTRLADLLDENRDYFAGAGDVSEVVVFSSSLERHGPTYEELSRGELGGR